MNRPTNDFNQQPQPAPPQKKTGKKVGIGCLGVVVGLAVIGGCTAAVVGGDADNSSPAPTQSATRAASPEMTPSEAPVKETAKPEKPAVDKPKAGPVKVTFKVWGSAPNGADTQYGSDSENLEAPSGANVTKTLKVDDDAMYYFVMAQLGGSGDIHCSVTINGHTKSAHAKGSYNICHAQLNRGLLGGWD